MCCIKGTEESASQSQETAKKLYDETLNLSNSLSTMKTIYLDEAPSEESQNSISHITISKNRQTVDPTKEKNLIINPGCNNDSAVVPSHTAKENVQQPQTTHDNVCMGLPANIIDDINYIINQGIVDGENINSNVDQHQTVDSKLGNVNTMDQKNDSDQTIDINVNGSQAIDLDVDSDQTVDPNSDNDDTCDPNVDTYQIVNQNPDSDQTMDPNLDSTQTINPNAASFQINDPNVDSDLTMNPIAASVQINDPNVDSDLTIDPNVSTDHIINPCCANEDFMWDPNTMDDLLLGPYINATHTSSNKNAVIRTLSPILVIEDDQPINVISDDDTLDVSDTHVSDTGVIDVLLKRKRSECLKPRRKTRKLQTVDEETYSECDSTGSDAGKCYVILMEWISLTLSDPGYFRQLTIRGGGGFKSPPPLRSRKLLCQSSPYHTCEFYQVFLA